MSLPVLAAAPLAPSPPCPRNPALIGASVLACALLLGCANPQATLTSATTPAPPMPTAPTAPAPLSAPADQVLAVVAKATGVQIYVCAATKTDPSRFEWSFKSPEADLFDVKGPRIGKHYGGPTWEANDGSKVVGELKARDDGPDPAAIPWLLLAAKSTSGSGIFARTLSIQRLDTVGGKAPAACDATQAGTELRVPYQATYYFYVARG